MSEEERRKKVAEALCGLRYLGRPVWTDNPLDYRDAERLLKVFPEILTNRPEPTTVSEEQIEKAALEFCEAFMGRPIWEEEWDQGPEPWRDYARGAFLAAGFRIEGDEA